jgi:pyrimidine operon attenuation protein/uracil phosphoribosyltransferase
VRTLLDETQLDFILKRLALQLIETHQDFSQSILIGIQPRGIALTLELKKILSELIGKNIVSGTLDISLYRDDLHLQNKIITLEQQSIPVDIENKNVVLIDDVLYSGRTIRAALDALVDLGRPKDVELLVLIDRRLHRHVPIQAKYIGKTVDSINEERVNVYLNENQQDNRVEIVSKKIEK